MGFYLDFMKPDVWNGLVLGSIVVGISLAILRILSDRSVHKRRQSQKHPDHLQDPTPHDKENKPHA